MDRKLKKQLQQLDEILAEYEAIVMHLDVEKANQKSPEGGWSALEIVEHLKAAEKGSLSYLEKKKGEFGLANSTSIGTYYRYSVLWLALVLPIKFKAPKSLEEPQGPYEPTVVFAEWKSVRNQLAQFIENHGDAVRGKDVFKHPRAGKMNLNLMLGFMLVHAKRHLDQLKRNV